MNALYTVLCVTAVVGAGCAWLLRKLATRPDMSGSAAEWLANFSAQSYAPMGRLLDERDFAFLEKQPGYDAGIAKRLRAERKEVFRAYLGRLVGDFNRLLSISKLMVVYAGEDRTDFAKSLWREQATFYFAVCLLHLRLALYPWVRVTWDVQGMVGSLAYLQDRLLQRAALMAPETSGL